MITKRMIGLVLLATWSSGTLSAGLRAQPAADRPANMDCYGDPLPAGALARFGTVRFQQGSSIFALALSPDGKTLVTAGGNNLLRFWDVATGKETRLVHKDERKITSNAVIFSSDGKFLASGGYGVFSLWRAKTGERLYHIVRFGETYSLAFSPDDKTLAVATGTDGPSLWDVGTGKQILQLQERGAAPGQLRGGLPCVAFSPDGRLLVSTYNRHIIFWDAATGKEAHRLRGHKGSLYVVALSTDGKLLASGGEDQTIRLWDVASRRLVHVLKGHHDPVKTLLFTPDGKTLVSASRQAVVSQTRERETVCFWDVASGQKRGALDKLGAATGDLALSRDGKLLAAADGDHVRLWDVATRKEIQPRGGHVDWIAGVAFSADGKRIVTAGGDCTVRLWEAASGRELRTFALDDEGADSAAFSPDGRLIAAASRDGMLRLWDAAGGRQLQRIQAHESQETYLAFSPDGARLVSAGRDETAALWDVATGKELRRIEGVDNGLICVAFSPNGKYIAAGELFGKRHLRKGPDAARPRIHVWDAATGKEIHALLGHTNIMIHGIAFSPDSAILASTGWDKTVRLWNMTTGREQGQLSGGGSSVAFSPDGRMLAAGGYENVIQLWETATLSERLRFAGHQANVSALAFSPDGRKLLSGSGDATALLWEVRRVAGAAKMAIADGETLWQTLAERDAAKAYHAITVLAASPASSLPLLRQRVQAVKAPDPQRLARLLADLDHERFEVREKAMRQIELIGELTQPALRKALADKPSLEAKRRIEQLLVNIEPAKSPEQLRALRALEVLECIGTPPARQVLETLAGGVAEARLTREAKASLTRLAARTPP